MVIFTFIITLALYIILNFYVGRRILLFLSVFFHNINKFVFWSLYVLCTISFFLTYIVPRFKFTKYIKVISGYYIGALIYLLIFILIVDFFRLLFRYTEKIPNNELFKKLESKYGTYAVLGNHDSGKSYEEMVEFFKQADIKLIQDENISISDEFILCGRKDATPIGVQGENRKSIKELLDNVDDNKPIIMLDHQPTSINEAELNNVDLLLSGHTHKGQLFPGNLITNKLFLVDYGYLKVNDLNVIVSSGVGTWGPPIRICSESEITNIKLEY